jgi:hypothetical protein
MSVRVLVPTQRLTVGYVLVSGDPFTLVEEFVLRTLEAYGQNGATLDELGSVLTLPRATLLGSSEALIRAALVGLGPGTDRLMLTRHGRQALNSAPPPSTPWQPMRPPPGFASQPERRSDTVLMDLVHGLVASDTPDSPIPLTTKRRHRDHLLESRKAVRDLIVNRLTAVLKRQRHQWVAKIISIRPVGPPQHIPIRATPETDTIVGLPPGWNNPQLWTTTLHESGIF